MCIFIHATAEAESTNGLQKAEDAIKQSLFEYLQDPLAERRLSEELSRNTERRNRQAHKMNSYTTASLPTTSLSDIGINRSFSGTIHERDDTSLTGRPRKFPRTDTPDEILSVPLWVTNGKNDLLCKLIGLHINSIAF
jgi:hypothetical protein